MNLVNGISCLQSLADDEDTFVGRLPQSLVYIVDNQFFIFNESVHSLADHPETFLDCLLERTSDSHHLTD